MYIEPLNFPLFFCNYNLEWTLFALSIKKNYNLIHKTYIMNIFKKYASNSKGEK